MPASPTSTKPGASPWLRVEGEISYRRNSVDKVTVAGEGTTPRSGHISALAAMANAWADYQVAPNVTVHAGGGIGVASVKLKIDAFSFDIDPPRYGVNDSDTVFAFQLGAGTAWRFSPTMSVTLDYRYFQAVNPTFDVKTSELAKFRDNYQSHSVMVGFRSNFSSGP
jgi:OOP family OmpA-OmpF porin